MTDKKDNRKTILLDANIIGTSPFVMKELILRGYRINAVSPSSDILLERQQYVVVAQKRDAISERRYNLN